MIDNLEIFDLEESKTLRREIKKSKSGEDLLSRINKIIKNRKEQ